MDPILLADALVTIHLLIMLFVVVGLVLIVTGWLLGWGWVRNFRFRLVHLLVIVIVAGQAIYGVQCPLWIWERELRGGEGHLHDLENASAIGRFAQKVLYHDATPTMLLILYSTVALLVLVSWGFVPVRWPWQVRIDALRGEVGDLQMELVRLRERLDALASSPARSASEGSSEARSASEGSSEARSASEGSSEARSASEGISSQARPTIEGILPGAAAAKHVPSGQG